MMILGCFSPASALKHKCVTNCFSPHSLQIGKSVCVYTHTWFLRSFFSTGFPANNKQRSVLLIVEYPLNRSLAMALNSRNCVIFCTTRLNKRSRHYIACGSAMSIKPLLLLIAQLTLEATVSLCIFALL